LTRFAKIGNIVGVERVMKSRVQISRLAVVCVLCTSAISGAFGAASVRSLGGAGTYSSASSAAAGGGAPSGAINAVRAGSMRVAPSAGGASASGSSNRGTATTGRVATAPRLSIGKYLGGGTSVSGGSSIKNQKPGSGVSNSGGGSMDPGIAGALTDRVGELESQVGALYTNDEIDGFFADKQNVLTGDGYIEIEDDEIFLNIDALKDGLETIVGANGREVEISKNATHIQWRYVGDTQWQDLIAISELVGPQGPQGLTGPQGPAGEKGEKGDKGDPGEGLDSAKYSTTEQMNQAIKTAIADAGHVTSTEMANALSDKADKTQLAAYATKTAVEESITNATADLAPKAWVNTALADKANVSDVYTKGQSDAKYLTEHQSLADYAKSADVYTKTQVDEKVADIVAGDMSAALSEYAKTADVNTALEKKANVTDLADYAKGATVTALEGRVNTLATDVDEMAVDVSGAVADAALAVSTAGAAKTAADAASGVAASALTAAGTASDKADAAKTAADAATTSLALKADAENVYTKSAADEKFATKKALEDAVVEAGNIDLSGYAKTEDLGTLAAKDTITNADVADDAAIAKTKLAADVQASLTKADQAVTVEGAPEEGDFVLAISNGQKGWFEVVTE